MQQFITILSSTQVSVLVDEKKTPLAQVAQSQDHLGN